MDQEIHHFHNIPIPLISYANPVGDSRNYVAHGLGHTDKHFDCRPHRSVKICFVTSLTLLRIACLYIDLKTTDITETS